MERYLLQQAIEAIFTDNSIPDADELADSIVESMLEDDEVTSDRTLLEDYVLQKFDNEGLEEPEILAEDVIDFLLDLGAFDESDEPEDEG